VSAPLATRGETVWDADTVRVEAPLTVPAGAVLRCAACGAPARLVSGDEIVLEQIEMEVP
jgi:Zn finger protein HypA/HybF involved in hydrogenase expression